MLPKIDVLLLYGYGDNLGEEIGDSLSLEWVESEYISGCDGDDGAIIGLVIGVEDLKGYNDEVFEDFISDNATTAAAANLSDFFNFRDAVEVEFANDEDEVNVLFFNSSSVG